MKSGNIITKRTTEKATPKLYFPSENELKLTAIEKMKNDNESGTRVNF